MASNKSATSRDHSARKDLSSDQDEQDMNGLLKKIERLLENNAESIIKQHQIEIIKALEFYSKQVLSEFQDSISALINLQNQSIQNRLTKKVDALESVIKDGFKLQKGALEGLFQFQLNAIWQKLSNDEERETSLIKEEFLPSAEQPNPYHQSNQPIQQLLSKSDFQQNPSKSVNSMNQQNLVSLCNIPQKNFDYEQDAQKVTQDKDRMAKRSTPLITCEICNQEGFESQKFKKHMKDIHNMIIMSYKCWIECCDFSTKSGEQFANHMYRSHSSTVCVCNQKFASKISFYAHIRSCKGYFSVVKQELNKETKKIVKLNIDQINYPRDCKDTYF